MKTTQQQVSTQVDNLLKALKPNLSYYASRVANKTKLVDYEDAYQELCIETWKAALEYEEKQPKNVDIGRWVHTRIMYTASRLIDRAIRKHRREQESLAERTVLMNHIVPDPSTEIINRVSLESYLKDQPDRIQVAIRMRLSGHTETETAQVLELSSRTIRTYWKAMKKSVAMLN